MKVEFAPLNIPLARRLQTAAVLQWVLSFLLLGKDPARAAEDQAKRRSAGTAVPCSQALALQGRPCGTVQPCAPVGRSGQVEEGA